MHCSNRRLYPKTGNQQGWKWLCDSVWAIWAWDQTVSVSILSPANRRIELRAQTETNAAKFGIAATGCVLWIAFYCYFVNSSLSLMRDDAIRSWWCSSSPSFGRSTSVSSCRWWTARSKHLKISPTSAMSAFFVLHLSCSSRRPAGPSTGVIRHNSSNEYVFKQIGFNTVRCYTGAI